MSTNRYARDGSHLLSEATLHAGDAPYKNDGNVEVDDGSLNHQEVSKVENKSSSSESERSPR